LVNAQALEQRNQNARQRKKNQRLAKVGQSGKMFRHRLGVPGWSADELRIGQRFPVNIRSLIV
jgi:hypothetical protein